MSSKQVAAPAAVHAHEAQHESCDDKGVGLDGRSPLLSGALAFVGLHQVKRREQSGFGLAIAALAVAAAVTALHVAMWIHCGRASFELLTTAHW